MKFSERFWTETIPPLSVAAEAALLHLLLRRPTELPPGVFQADVAALESLGRFAWAAPLLESELASAPGISRDRRTALAVVWEVALADLPRAPMPARGHGRRVAATCASWTPELFNRIRQALDGSVRAGFEAGFAERAAKPAIRAMRPRPRVDPFELDLQVVKRLEHKLRTEFADIDDLGLQPSPADRRGFVQVQAAGFSTEQIADALRGRAEKCRRSRRWRDIDTAQVFLRIAWLCADTRRLEEAEQVGASLKVPDTGIVTGADGRRWAHGREIVE